MIVFGLNLAPRCCPAILARLAGLALASLVLVACTTTGSNAAHRSRAAVAQPQPAPDEDTKFYDFVRSFRATALGDGITASVYDRAMADISLNAHIIDLNTKQPEFTRAVWDYLDSAVSDLRVQNGRDALAANATTLANLESRYGVPKEILVAIWGIESNYGSQMGHYDMFEALATLGYDGPRADYARHELISAFRMVQQDGFDPRAMPSSWAGAFGETQFTPSAFLDHAVDGDGDGKKDLWHSVADALASTASLLAEAGWRRGEPWSYEVRLPQNFPYAEAELGDVRPLDHWRELGVTTALGHMLPGGPADGAIVLPAGARGPAFLVFHNFGMILRYNNATSYALAVGLLAGRIAGDVGVVHAWPRDETPLSRDETMAFQRDLKALGYDPGAIDGRIGAHVRAALRAYQRARGLPPDGFATQDLLKRMERESAEKGG